jgi:hypothetical protein
VFTPVSRVLGKDFIDVKVIPFFNRLSVVSEEISSASFLREITASQTIKPKNNADKTMITIIALVSMIKLLFYFVVAIFFAPPAPLSAAREDVFSRPAEAAAARNKSFWR